MPAASRVPVPSPFEGPWPAGEDVVAVGGTLEPSVVLDAYRHGVFPFHEAGHPVTWWCPDPRAILPLEDVHVPRRLARTARRGDLRVLVDTAFEPVMRACARNRSDGVWIHDGMVRCYTALHVTGHAHSLEVWRRGRLVGGIYGVAFGAGFAAESKFHAERDTSKVALVHLVSHLRARGFRLLDVQFSTAHLEQFGVIEIPRSEYLRRVRAVRDEAVVF